MANANAPFGLMPEEHLSGTMNTVMGHRYYVKSDNSSAFYIGSPVKLTNTGDANGVPGVDVAAGTDTLVGTVIGIEQPNVNTTSMVGTTLALEQVSIPATKSRDYYVYVADDPHQIFVMQCGAVTTNLVSTKLNNNASMTITAPSPSTLPNSAAVIDNASIATNNTLNLALMGLWQGPNNSLGAYQIMRCKINLHQYANGRTGV